MLAGHHGFLEGPVPKSDLSLPFSAIDNHFFSHPHFYGNDGASSHPYVKGISPLTTSFPSLGLRDFIHLICKMGGWMDWFMISLLPDLNCYGNSLNLISSLIHSTFIEH